MVLKLIKVGMWGFLLLTGAVFADIAELELLWETSGFKTPESVIYDTKRDRLYVSNMDGGGTDKDGKGSIAIVSLEGKIENLEWISGLNAPKGLAIYNDRLYVADVDTLVVIDIETGKILNRYPVADAKFLNDVTAAADGRIFVSDMMMNRIHLLKGNEFTIWLEGDVLNSPNGLHAEDKTLVVGTWGVMTDGFATEVPGRLKEIRYSDKHIQDVGPQTPIGNLDGVEVDEHGDYFVTDWMKGRLLEIHRNGVLKLILTLKQGSADHEYIQSKRLMLIPMMLDGTLRAYKVN